MTDSSDGQRRPTSTPQRPRPRSGADPFGDVLPARSRDEEAAGWSEGVPDEGVDPDEHLRREVPPHHR